MGCYKAYSDAVKRLIKVSGLDTKNQIVNFGCSEEFKMIWQFEEQDRKTIHQAY